MFKTIQSLYLKNKIKFFDYLIIGILKSKKINKGIKVLLLFIKKLYKDDI